MSMAQVQPFKVLVMEIGPSSTKFSLHTVLHNIVIEGECKFMLYFSLINEANAISTVHVKIVFTCGHQGHNLVRVVVVVLVSINKKHPGAFRKPPIYLLRVFEP
jgi:hypothetical protein